MPTDGFSDDIVDSQCAAVRQHALACTTVSPAWSLGPVASKLLGWSPVVMFGVAIGVGMSVVVAQGTGGSHVPPGAPMGNPDNGMVHSLAFAIMTDESRPSWLAPAKEEAPHAAAPEEPKAADVPQPFNEETPGVEASSSSEAPTFAPEIRTDNKVGVYLTSNSIGRKDFFNETLDSIIASGGSSIVFDVKGSRVYFHSAAPAANEMDLVKPVYDLPATMKAAHDRGLYVIGRFIAIKDDGITTKKPETRVTDPTGKHVLSAYWVDPSNEMAIQYNSEVVCELAQAGIDEINLDYIRFSTADFGALGVYSGQEKADHVETFIRAMRASIDRCNPNTKLGISTFAILGWDYARNVETLGQDVVRFAPLVDVISPMAYPATFTSPEYYIPGKNPRSRMYWLVYRTLTGYQKLLGPEDSKKLRPWIQGYGVVKKDMRDQIDAVYDAGLCGFQVWNAGNNYKPVYAALKDEHSRPETCGGTGRLDAVPPGPVEIPGMNW